jgi:hypothetical protein
MKTNKTLLLIAILSAFSFAAFAQSSPLTKRTTFKTDKFDFGAGGTVSVIGAPNGSIRVEGWPKREIEISAEIEIQAPTEADLDRLSAVTTFVLDEGLGSTTITSVGPHNRKLIRQLDKKFPKALLEMPFRIDYVIKVPQYCDLIINGGKGDLAISGVEGAMKINFLESNATLELVGGATTAIFGSGTVDVRIPTAGWRGRPTEIQIASGTLNVTLPTSLNAEVDATILRTGKIENSFEGFKPRVRKAEFTDRSIAAKAGIGGVPLKFTVGDGTLKITEMNRPG